MGDIFPEQIRDDNITEQQQKVCQMLDYKKERCYIRKIVRIRVPKIVFLKSF
jgi:hypothetical protein